MGRIKQPRVSEHTGGARIAVLGFVSLSMARMASLCPFSHRQSSDLGALSRTPQSRVTPGETLRTEGKMEAEREYLECSGVAVVNCGFH